MDQQSLLEQALKSVANAIFITDGLPRSTMTPEDPNITPWDIHEEDFPLEGSSSEKLSFLLRYAILAPSTHNTQPWKFAAGSETVDILIDRTRWLKVADADQRELHVSVGCALENLLIAAEHFGYRCLAAYFPDAEKAALAARVTFLPDGHPSAFRSSRLFRAITLRHTNRNVYLPHPISFAALRQLQMCCVEEDVQLHLSDDANIKQEVNSLVVRSDTVQFADPAWREELAHWLGEGGFGTPRFMAKIAQ